MRRFEGINESAMQRVVHEEISFHATTGRSNGVWAARLAGRSAKDESGQSAVVSTRAGNNVTFHVQFSFSFHDSDR